MSDRFVVGRDRELAQLQLAIGHGNDGLRLAMLSGPSGLGKTTLAECALEDAGDRGFRTILIRGRAGSLSTPFAPLIEALPELGSLLTLVSNADSNIEQAGMALVQLVIELAETQQLLVVVDDAQALDESTIAVLPYLSGIAESVNLTLLFIEQTDAIGIADSYRSYVDGLLSRRVVSHLELGPMSPEGLRLIVARELGLDADADVPEDIVVRAEGNPWFARELAHGCRSGSSEIPSNIAAAATSRLHSLDEVGQEMVSTISVCPEGAHIAWLEALSGQRPRHFVATMERVVASGIVREDGDILTIAHPLMQQAILEEQSTAMRRAIHLELVETLAQTQLDPIVTARACAYHLAAAGRRDDAVDQYLAAAEANEIVGKLHEARVDLMAALAIEDRIEQRVTLLRRAAMLAMQLGSDESADLWTELSRLAASTHDDRLYAFALYHTYIASNGSRTEPLQRAANLDPSTNGWASLAEGCLAFNDGDLRRALASDEQTVKLSRSGDDALLHANALRNLAVTQAELGMVSEAVATYREAIQQLIGLRAHDRVVLSWVSMSHAYAYDSDIASAVREIDAADEYVVDLGLEQLRPYTLANRAGVLAAAGELETAHQLASEAAVLDASFRNSPAYRHYTTAFVSIVRAEIANEMGTSNAGELADLSLEVVRELGLESWELEARREVIRARARRSGVDAILGELTELETVPEPIYVATTALWLLRQSVLNESAAGVDRVRALRASFEQWDASRRTRMVRDEIDATLAALDGASTCALDEVAKAWSDAGCALDALRVNAVTGAIVLRAGNKEAAKTYLQAAKTGLAACGASADADMAAALLRQTGARSRASSRTTKVGPLTKRELEIARLVASGLKNSEVAGTLFLAEKTVAAHLSNIYGKVEVRSRVQLGQWIRENDPDFETTLASVG